MAFTVKGTLATPGTPTSQILDGWHFRSGFGGPSFLSYPSAQTVDFFVTGRGSVGYPDSQLDGVGESIPSARWANLSGKTAGEIDTFLATEQHRSIGKRTLSMQALRTGGRQYVSFYQLVRPSYPFYSYATEEAFDPSVIQDTSAGFYDKCCANSALVKDGWSKDLVVFAWIFISKEASREEVVLQKGVNWQLVLTGGHYVRFEYIGGDGYLHQTIALPLNARKARWVGANLVEDSTALQANAWRESPTDMGKPVLICAGPGLLAVSTHQHDTYPDPSVPEEYSFIYTTTSLNGNRPLSDKILALHREPLTLGNDWTGEEDKRLSSAVILSARVDMFGKDPTRNPSGTDDNRGYSLMQTTINQGVCLVKNTYTRWLFAPNKMEGEKEVLDGGPQPKYNIRLYGGAEVRDYPLLAVDYPEAWKIYSDVGDTNAFSNAYIDVFVDDSGTPPWMGQIAEAKNGELETDDEDGQGLDVTLNFVIRSPDRTAQETVQVYAWENIGKPTHKFLPTVTVHRLYLMAVPLNGYAHDDEDTEWMEAPTLIQLSDTGTYVIKGLHLEANTERTYAYAKITPFSHTEKMVYVGYGATKDGGNKYHCLLEREGYSSPRSRYIFRAALNQEIVSPILFKHQDDYYVVFGLERSGSTDGINDMEIRIAYKRANTMEEWELLPVPLMEPLRDNSWEGESVVPGGIVWESSARRLIFAYAGYDGSSWSLGKVILDNLTQAAGDNKRGYDSISGTLSTLTPTYFRPVGPFLKIDNQNYVFYSTFNTDTSKYEISYAAYEENLDEESLSPGEEFQEYEEELSETDTLGRIRGLHRYYKQTGQKRTVVVCGNNVMKAIENKDSLGRLVCKFYEVAMQTDIPLSYMRALPLYADSPVFMETFQDWVYIAHKGDILTRWGGGLLKRVGVDPPTTAPTCLIQADGSLEDGETYYYRYSYYTSTGESQPSPSSVGVDISVPPANQSIRVQWTVPPAGSPDVLGAYLYVSQDGVTFTHVRTIASRVTNTWTDDGTATTRTNATGVAGTSLDAVPPDLDGICAYENTLFGWRGSRFYWSLINKPDSWPTDNVYQLESNGEDIEIMTVCGNYLLAFTSTMIFVVQAAGTDSEDGDLVLRVVKSRAPMGTNAPRSVIVTPWEGTNVSFYLGSDRHIWLFNGVDAFQASEKIYRTTRRISKKYMHQAAGAFFDGQYILTAPFKANVNNASLVLDIRRKGWSYHPNQHLSCYALFSSQADGYILVGGDSRTGKIYQVFDPTSPDDDGEGIPAKMKTKSFDFQIPESEKRIRKLYYDFHGTTGYAIITVSVDDDQLANSQEVQIPQFMFLIEYSSRGTHVHSIASQLSVLGGTFANSAGNNTDQDVMTGQLLFPTPVMNIDQDRYISLPPEITGKNFSIEVSVADASPDFQIDSITLGVRVERVR